MRELDRVVAKIFKSVESAQTIDKETFERLLDGIILQVAKNRGVSVQQVASLTDQVIADIPRGYEKLSKELKGWETLIIFLYIKYQQLLGVDTSIFDF